MGIAEWVAGIAYFVARNRRARALFPMTLPFPPIPMKPIRILSRSIVACVIFFPVAAWCGLDTFSGVAPAWGTAAAWSLGAIPGTGDNAVIAATGTVDVRGSTLGGLQVIQDLTFNSTAAVTLVNNSSSTDMLLALNGGRGAGVPLIATTGDFAYAITGPGTNATPHPLGLQLRASGDVNVAANILTISAVLSESGGARSITKTGAGRLTLSAVNTFTGGANVSAGILEVTANGALGSGPTVINGGTLEINLANATLTTSDIELNAGGQIATRGNVTLNNSITLNGGTLATRTTDAGTYAGAIHVIANSFVNLRSYSTPASSLSMTISGLLSGASGLTINGNDPQTNGGGRALILTNPANTYSGTFAVSNNQILRGAPASTGDTLGTGVVSLSGGTLQLRDEGTGNSGVLSYNNGIAMAGDGTIDVDHVSTNTGNSFQLGALSIGAQTLHATGANGYGVRFGATTLTGAATFHPTTAPVTLGGVVSGGFGFTKTGAGNLVLSAANTYTGQTNVNEGTVTVTGSLAASSRIDVKTGATLDVTGAAGGFTVGASQILSGTGTVAGVTKIGNAGVIEPGDSLAAGSLSLGGLTLGTTVGDTSSIRVSPSVTPGSLQVTGALTTNGGSNSVTLNVVGNAISNGQYVLVDYAGSMAGTGFGAFKLGALPTPRLIATLVSNTANTSIDLSVTGNDFPIWKGAVSTEWSLSAIASPKNWVLNSNAATTTDFLSNDSVLFDDTASGATPIVDVSAADVVTTNLTFANAAKPYTISGTKAIGGAAGLTKSGAAPVTIGTTNSFTGAVTISGGGEIRVPAVANAGVNSPLGAGSAITLDGGTLTFTGANGSTNRPVSLGAGGGTIASDGTLTFSSPVAGGNALMKTGTGTLILTGANVYGSTTIAAGTVQFGDGVATGAPGTGLIADNGALAFNNAATVTFASEITGTGTLAKTGAGSLVLSGATANTFTGTTTVSGGNLILSKTSGVNAVGGNIVVATGGTVSYGTTAGQLQDHLPDTATISIQGGTFGGGAGDVQATPTAGVTDTVAGVSINGGTFDSGRNALVGAFNITGSLQISGGTVLVQRGGGIAAQTVQFTGGALNLDGGSTTAGQQSKLTVGAGGLVLAGTMINLNAGPSALAATSVGSVLVLNGDVTSSGTSGLARLNAATVTTADVDLGASVRTFQVTGALTIGADLGNAATDLAAAGILKTGAGKLVLDGAQNYFSLTNAAGRTDVTKPIGTGASHVTVSGGSVNFVASQSLASLVIGAGAEVSLGSVLPPAPLPDADFSREEERAVVVQAVPEPGSAPMVTSGLAFLMGRRWRRKTTRR